MLHTGVHDDYPSACATMRRRSIARHATGGSADVPSGPWKWPTVTNGPNFDRRRGTSRKHARAAGTAPGARPPRLGVTWAADDTEPGLSDSCGHHGIRRGRAGIRAGDRFCRSTDNRWTKTGQFPSMVLAATSPTEVRRATSGRRGASGHSGQSAGQPMRVGISWREDEAEPGSVIISQVTTGSAAYLAACCPAIESTRWMVTQFARRQEFRQLVTARCGPTGNVGRTPRSDQSRAIGSAVDRTPARSNRLARRHGTAVASWSADCIRTD